MYIILVFFFFCLLFKMYLVRLYTIIKATFSMTLASK